MATLARAPAQRPHPVTEDVVGMAGGRCRRRCDTVSGVQAGGVIAPVHSGCRGCVPISLRTFDRRSNGPMVATPGDPSPATPPAGRRRAVIGAVVVALVVGGVALAGAASGVFAGRDATTATG